MYLTETPFYILGVTSRDDKQMIIAKADEKSFDIDPDVCAKARAELTHPRKRLAAEMSWLPRVSIKKLQEVLSKLAIDPASLMDATLEHHHVVSDHKEVASLAPLAKLNLITSCLIHQKVFSGDQLKEVIKNLSSGYEEIDSLEIMRLINADRSVSGFPEVHDISWIEKELANRRRHYVKAIMDALNKLSNQELIETVTSLTEGNTNNGKCPSETLICGLVDRYEESVQGFLEKEAGNVRELIKRCRTATENSGSDEQIEKNIVHLCKILKNWDKVAQPIQLIANSRGSSHPMSNDLASELRSLAVALHNEHGLTKFARSLIRELEDIFAEDPAFVEQIKVDTSVLDEILRTQQEAGKANIEWVNEISFEKDFGHFPFKKKLKISPDGVSWRETLHPLDSISEILWGAKSTQTSINGIPTLTNEEYVIKFRGSVGTATIKPEFGHTYHHVVESLWKAVGARILTEMIHQLAQDSIIHIGRTRVYDNGIELVKHNLLKKNITIFAEWSEVTISNGNGSFLVSHRNEKKTYAEFPYMEIYNAHLFETAVRTFWEKGGTKLSSILKN